MNHFKMDNMHHQKTVHCYTIDDISAWQTELQENRTQQSTSSKITLPSLQRGFVWKPFQIEALWDSILRGYPIGAVLMSIANDQRELLDGQQRSTSIALGYYNPFDTTIFNGFLNLKENIPSVWIDLKPMERNNQGLKFGIRVLTRSHPWGYQLLNHRQTLSMSDREAALNFYRERISKDESSYTELKAHEINPWDAHFPVPLAFLLEQKIGNVDDWKRMLRNKMEGTLNGIRTKYSHENFVDYSLVEDKWLDQLYLASYHAKNLVIPEILINKDVIEEVENNPEEESESLDATLFIRLNSEGTRISGEELVYSLFKANFPELKILVEQIGLKYIAPSKIVNLFSRLILMELSEYDHFQQDITIAAFRIHIQKPEFKNKLKQIIQQGDSTHSEAKVLIEELIKIISKTRHDIPGILSKELIVKSPDLVLIFLIYLRKNRNLSEVEKEQLFVSYHYLALFNTDQKKTARQLFENLKSLGFQHLQKSIVELNSKNPTLLLPLLTPQEFEYFVLEHLIPLHFKSKRHYSDYSFLKEIIAANRENLIFLFKTVNDRPSENEDQMEDVHTAVEYWKSISERIYKNRTFLIFSQREYFIKQFGDFMEFDGIEDTNKPWDWDHIYPNSWVDYNKGISSLVRWLINTNGNFRALSYNENRSQSNHQSPYERFHDKPAVEKDSFINENDREHWLELTNSDKRLKENHSDLMDKKIEAFVNACFKRMCNLYSDWYHIFGKSF